MGELQTNTEYTDQLECPGTGFKPWVILCRWRLAMPGLQNSALDLQISMDSGAQSRIQSFPISQVVALDLTDLTDLTGLQWIPIRL